MRTILKVDQVRGNYKGYVKLSNGYIKLHIPKRSGLLDGRKLVIGQSYQITLNSTKASIGEVVI